MSDDAPTKRLPTTPPPTTPPPVPPTRRGRPGRTGRPSRAPMIAFIVLSVLLVAAVGVFVFVLISRSSDGTAQASNSPSASPAPSSTQRTTPPAPPPPPPGVFTTFVVPPSQQCTGRGNRRQNVDAQVTWATQNATQVWVAPGTGDAVSAGLEQVPLSGDQDSLPSPLAINCNAGSMTFTMTLIGADGAHVSRTWTVMVTDRHHDGP